MWAIVPFKGSGGAKRRLADHLSTIERANLVLAMLEDVLQTLTQVSNLDGICLVSRSDEAVAIARKHDILLFSDDANDLSGAVVQAGEYLATHHHARGTFFIPGDVPLITVKEIEQAVLQHQSVTLIPDRNDIGTNGALSSPPNAIEYLFDGKSFKPHRAAAQRAGVEAAVLRLPGFGLDIDTIDELKELLHTKSSTKSSIYLEESGIASRLTTTT